MGRTMIAIVRRSGGPALERVPIPHAEAADALVSVRVAGICRTDLFAADG